MSNKRKNKDMSARRRRMQERGRIPWGTLLPLIIILVVIVSVFAYISLEPKTATTTVNTSSFPFPCLANEGAAMHVHPWLSIVINGQNIAIPAGIGIPSSAACLEPVHTHDSSGIIHIESNTMNINYTLSDFFQIWNVTYGSITINGTNHQIVFNSTDILGFKADSTHKVVILVDGQSSNEYGSLVLNTLDYCNATNSNVAPCTPTASGSNPYYNGQPYPFGTGHKIVIEYETAA